MRASELRERTDADLHTNLDELRRELFTLRFQLATRQLANHRRIPAVKKDIARIHTLLREREIAAQYQALTGTETAAGAAESAD